MRRDTFFLKAGLTGEALEAMGRLQEAVYANLSPRVSALADRPDIDERERYRQLLHVVGDAVAEMIRESGENVACKSGCHHCCGGHPIYVQTYEICRLIEAVESHPRHEWLVERITAASPTSSTGTQAMCALLDEDGVCCVYQSRPVACASYHSFDEASCRAHAEGNGAAAVPLFPYAAANVVFDFGLTPRRERLGLDGSVVEINTALRAIYADESLRQSCLLSDGRPDFSPMRIGVDV